MMTTRHQGVTAPEQETIPAHNPVAESGLLNHVYPLFLVWKWPSWDTLIISAAGNVINMFLIKDVFHPWSIIWPFPPAPWTEIHTSLLHIEGPAAARIYQSKNQCIFSYAVKQLLMGERIMKWQEQLLCTGCFTLHPDNPLFNKQKVTGHALNALAPWTLDHVQ